MSNESSLREKFGSAVKWIAIGNISSQIVRWIITFWVIRILTPDDYGTVAIAGVLEGLLIILTQQGLVSPLIQKKEISAVQTRQYFGTVIVIHTLFFAILQLSALPIALLYENEQLEPIIRFSSICFLILIFDTLPTAKLTKEMRFKELSIAAFIANLGAALATLGFALNGYGVWSIIYGQVLRVLISTLAKNLYCFYLPAPSFGFKHTSELLKFGVLMSLTSIVSYVVLSIDVAIGGTQLSTVELGIYAVALQVSLIPLKKIGPMVKQATFPMISSIQDDLARVKKVLYKIQSTSMLIIFPIFWGISATAELFVPVILGDKWTAAILPIQILTLVIPLRFSAEVYSACLKGLGYAKTMLNNSLLSLLIMTPAISIGMFYGSVGLASAWLLGYLLVYIILVHRYKKVLSLDYLTFIKPLILPLAACSSMYALVELVKYLASDFSLMLSLLLATAVSSIYYCLFILFFNKNILIELKTTLIKKK